MIRGKNKTTIFTLSSLLLLLVLIVMLGTNLSTKNELNIVALQDAGEHALPESYGENKQCMDCHAKKRFTYHNENIGRGVKKNMCPDYLIDSTEYYAQVHGSFYCTDCHAPEFESYPHPAEIKGEQMWTCLDCHGYDEEYADYNFEAIQEQFYESVHYNGLGDEFSCWKCHDPHSYRNVVREAQNNSDVIVYANNICLKCHANIDQFKLLTENDGVNIVEHHDWLPNQELHFKKVRCLECHSAVSDTVLIPHLIKPSGEAVKNCVECHSANSLLISTLYKYESKQQRDELGFLNGVILNDSYVIGANRNYYLNVASLVIFILTMAGICVHATLRIIKCRKK
ncbi:MAG: cytochrome c3 family protein [Bacteroidota bacterium]